LNAFDALLPVPSARTIRFRDVPAMVVIHSQAIRGGLPYQTYLTCVNIRRTEIMG
jgi:hypothetical protein